MGTLYFTLFLQISDGCIVSKSRYNIASSCTILLGDLPLSSFCFSNCFFGSSNMFDIALRALLALLDLEYVLA